jgi:flavin reductase (DIM6/NTAB) family NADH-FMN oxidoreductase RutF
MKKEREIMRENFKPGNMLYPLPAVMISCQEEGKRPNVLTVAWAGTICSDPAMVSVSIRPSRYSHEIISKTKEFVINLVTEDLTRTCDYVGVKSGRDIDKFKECNLTESPSSVVKCPGIAESPVCIECKVEQVIPLGTHDMFIAKVVNVNVDKDRMDENGKFDLNGSNLITYSHGEYFTLGKKIGKFGYSVKKS